MGGTSLFLFFVTPPTERERERERESPQGETLIGCQVLEYINADTMGAKLH